MLSIRQTVRERSRGRCEVCGSPIGVEQHHIVHGRGKRKECETEVSVIALCYYHHRSEDGVHGKNGHELDIRLKKWLQSEYFRQGKEEAEVRELMGGRLY